MDSKFAMVFGLLFCFVLTSYSTNGSPIRDKTKPICIRKQSAPVCYCWTIDYQLECSNENGPRKCKCVPVEYDEDSDEDSDEELKSMSDDKRMDLPVINPGPVGNMDDMEK